MSTEVRHGPSPDFQHKVTEGAYGLMLAGFYTTTDGWTAGGVTSHKYLSERPEKRLNELLGMRTIFHHWWIREWLAASGTIRAGEAHAAASIRDVAEKLRLEL